MSMTGYLLIDMTTHKIIGAFDKEDDAIAEHERLGPPKHVALAGGQWDMLSAADLVKIFNNLPGVKPVKRFADRNAAVRRVNAALANPGTDAPEPGDEVAPSPIVEDPNSVTTPKETNDVKTKTKRKAKSKPATDQPRAARADTPTKVAMTATGKKDGIRFQEGSPRARVFAKIKEAEEILITELQKKCAAFVNRAQLMGCLQKLKAKSYIKVS